MDLIQKYKIKGSLLIYYMIFLNTVTIKKINSIDISNLFFPDIRSFKLNITRLYSSQVKKNYEIHNLKNTFAYRK